MLPRRFLSSELRFLSFILRVDNNASPESNAAPAKGPE